MGACEFKKPYMHKLDEFLCSQRKGGETFYPQARNIFKAFKLTRLEDVKVVILGQDPYHSAGQATGLAFAVPKGTKLPPSLGNIYQEIAANCGAPPTTGSDLTSWAKQGVLLLNCFLTVRAGEPKSHRENGWWARFTDQALELVSYQRPDVVFCLWGREAQRRKRLLVDSRRNRILTAGHPSPQSAKGFFGCGHFSEVNRLLKARGHKPIRW